MRDALELETRRRIYAEVSRFPGTYRRELQRPLGLQPGQLEYHLDVLVKAGLLSAQEEGGRRRYFVAAEISHPDKAVIGLLRQRAVRRILLEILLHPGARFQEILAAVGGAKSPLSFHLRKVTDTGLVLAEAPGWSPSSRRSRSGLRTSTGRRSATRCSPRPPPPRRSAPRSSSSTW